MGCSKNTQRSQDLRYRFAYDSITNRGRCQVGIACHQGEVMLQLFSVTSSGHAARWGVQWVQSVWQWSATD